MRTLFFVMVLLAFLSLTTNALAAERFPFGIKGGMSWATWDWGSEFEVEGNSDYIGYQIGAFVELDFDWFLSIETEVLYAHRGTKIIQGKEEAIFKTTYLDVPLLAKFTIELEYSRPYFLLGPSFNFLMNAEAVYGDEIVDIKDQLETMEIDAVGGIGIHMKSVLLEGRYNLALTDLNQDGGIKSSFFSLNFGITF